MKSPIMLVIAAAGLLLASCSKSSADQITGTYIGNVTNLVGGVDVAEATVTEINDNTVSVRLIVDNTDTFKFSTVALGADPNSDSLVLTGSGLSGTYYQNTLKFGFVDNFNPRQFSGTK